MPRPVLLKKLWVLMVTGFVDMLGYYVILALLPFYGERFQATPFVVGCLVAAFAFAQMVTSPLWGRISDRWGRRPVILLGLAVSATAYIVFALADSVWLLFVCRLAQGTGAGTISAVMAYVSDAVSPQERAHGLGWLTAATSAAAMWGPALGSLAGQLDPDAPGYLAAVLCLFNLAFVWFLLPDSTGRTRPTPEETRSRTESIRRSIIDVLRRPSAPISSLIWVYYLGIMAFEAMTAVIALYLNRSFAVTEKNIWVYFFYVGAISVLMRALVVGPAVRRLGEVRILRLGALCMGLGMTLTPLPSAVPVLALVVMFVPIGTALFFPCTTSLVSRNAPPAQVGQILGVQQSFGAVSRILGPIWAGAAFQHLAIESPFWIGGGMVLLVAALAAHLPRPPAAEEKISALAPTAVANRKAG